MIEDLKTVLANVRTTLTQENPGICDTIWYHGSPAETLVDYIDAALEHAPPTAKVDRVFASAPGGESGWLPIENASREIGAIAIVAVRHSDTGNWIVGEAEWVADEDDREDGGAWWWSNTHGEYHADSIKNRHGRPEFCQPLPAPPGAPPVSAPPAESARYTDEDYNRLHQAHCLTEAKREAAEAKCRELEGAAQAARGALEACDERLSDLGLATVGQARVLIAEALASLVAVLDGSGGAE